MGRLLSDARNLRRSMTREERHLWYDFLRSYPDHVYKQRIMGDYVVDFYCAAAQLVIELDGSQHYDEKQQAYDTVRTSYLESLDLVVLRIPNNQVNENFEGVCAFIHRMIQQRKNDICAPIEPLY